MKSQKKCTTGIIISILIILAGLLFVLGVFGGTTHYVGGTSYSYDSGYATFGADFYNYVSNNAAKAAEGASASASNSAELVELVSSFCGFFLMGFGALSLCFFAYLRAKGNEELDAATPVIPGSPAAPVVPTAPVVPAAPIEAAAPCVSDAVPDEEQN